MNAKNIFIKIGCLFVPLLFVIFGCDKLGPHSNKLIGTWTKSSNHGDYRRTKFDTLIEDVATLRLDKSGNGTMVDKVNVFSGNKSWQYTTKYVFNWQTRIDGVGNLLILKYRKGIVVKDSLISMQDVSKEIAQKMSKPDSTYFELQSNGSLICHVPHDNKIFPMD